MPSVSWNFAYYYVPKKVFQFMEGAEPNSIHSHLCESKLK